MTRSSFKAALHELRCDECRVSWRSWCQRLAGIRAGFSPPPRRTAILTTDSEDGDGGSDQPVTEFIASSPGDER